ncbi:MAG: hypothetical protein RAO94_08190 [Candidatus Stygibacter australis]|nr:hypothetical protein [Candidatus Stygibacter australis]MDP8322316.1 hypothetical protein [Candidatus Stygibacter australis]
MFLLIGIFCMFNICSAEGDFSVDLSTDKAVYHPGESVRFSFNGTMPAGAKIRYRQLDKT